MLLAVLWLMLQPVSAQPRISIFFDHVTDIARQEKITITEAAQRVRQLGVEGIDVRVQERDYTPEECKKLFENCREELITEAKAWMKAHGGNENG